MPGNVVAIFSAARTCRRLRPRRSRLDAYIDELREVRLPDERSGTILVFSVHDRMSYGLIVESHAALRIGDFVKHPDFGHRDMGTATSWRAERRRAESPERVQI